MTLISTSRKSILAVCLAAPLTLTACGSGEDDGAVVSELATETNVITEAAPEGEPGEGDDKDKDKDKDKDGNPDEGDPNNPDDPAAAGAPEPGAGGVVNPFEDGNLPVVEVQPIEGGKAASQEDIAAMTKTMNNIYNPPGLVEWSRTIMNNSCKRVVDQTNAELQRKGTSLEKTEGEMRQAVAAAERAGQPVPPIPPSQAKLTDVKVDGNVASATVTVTTQGQSETGVQRFARENGQWKVCN